MPLKYCNKASVNSFASTKSSNFQRLSILRVFLFWFAVIRPPASPLGSTNMLERLIGALLLERHEKWQLETRPSLSTP